MGEGKERGEKWKKEIVRISVRKEGGGASDEKVYGRLEEEDSWSTVS